MNKIYYINIKGRTLEGRNLKELLSRAVNQKRNMDRIACLQNRMHGQGSIENTSGSFGNTCRAATI
jgi:hypothetical protein